MLTVALALLPFAVSMSITPGPNNIMVTASGANFGFRRTLPHILGISLGFPVMMITVGWGFGSLLEAYPAVHRILKYAGAAYLLYLAWKIATSAAHDAGVARGRPLTFLQAAAFQWINPKAWVIAVGAIGTYTTVGGDLYAETLVMSAVMLLTAAPSVSIWTLFGVAMGRLLASPRARTAFNLVMAALLVLSLLPIFA